MKWLNNLIESFFTKVPNVIEEPLVAKDPMDWTLTKNSREWQSESYCPNCKKTTEHHEIMTDICNGCGFFGYMTKRRAYRAIYNGTKWVTQFKYGNGPTEFEIK